MFLIAIIANNIIFAFAAVSGLLAYSRFKKTSEARIKELEQKVQMEFEQKKQIENNLVNAGIDGVKDQVKSLMAELETAHKEKEDAIKLRLEAEKKAETAILEIQANQKKMIELKDAQEKFAKAAIDEITRIGNSMYRKLTEGYKSDAKANHNLLEAAVKSIDEHLDQITKIAAAPTANENTETKPTAKKPLTKKADKAQEETIPNIEDPAKKLILELVETMQANGHLVNRNYFLPSNIEGERAKLMLCDVAFLDEIALHILDFKACKYLAEFNKLKNEQGKEKAAGTLKQRLDKYLTYISNPKYKESILKVFSGSKFRFDDSEISVILPTKKDVLLVKEIGYYDKLLEHKIRLFDFDEANSLVL